MTRLLAYATLALTLAGCNLKGALIPGAEIPFAKADYQVLGSTSAEECGTYIIGIDWGHLFKNEGSGVQSGLVGLLMGQPLSPSTPEGRRALYYALEKMPDATHLLAAREHVTAKGLVLGPAVLFGERCSKVTARGVKIGNGPTLNQ